MLQHLKFESLSSSSDRKFRSLSLSLSSDLKSLSLSSRSQSLTTTLGGCVRVWTYHVDLQIHDACDRPGVGSGSNGVQYDITSVVHGRGYSTELCIVPIESLSVRVDAQTNRMNQYLQLLIDYSRPHYSGRRWRPNGRHSRLGIDPEETPSHSNPRNFRPDQRRK